MLWPIKKIDGIRFRVKRLSISSELAQLLSIVDRKCDRLIWKAKPEGSLVFVRSIVNKRIMEIGADRQRTHWRYDASGFREVGSHDWFAAGCCLALEKQRRAGGWRFSVAGMVVGGSVLMFQLRNVHKYPFASGLAIVECGQTRVRTDTHPYKTSADAYFWPLQPYQISADECVWPF